MIGVLCPPAHAKVVEEFFELFKTPWEFFRAGGEYAVLLCSGESIPQSAARLVIVHGPDPASPKSSRQLPSETKPPTSVLRWRERRLPVYGACRTFPTSQSRRLTEASSGAAAIHFTEASGSTTVRLGFDLFAEIEFLLTAGQPAEQAGVPVLDLHLAFLRELIADAALPLLEIPPLPAGHDFIACLTHDVDHPVLRNHWCDHTMFGFLHRATVGSLLHVLKGRATLGKLGRNLVAAFSLPFIHLGLARDFWRDFHRYTQIEKGLGSTFFVLPFKHRPGRGKDGPSRPGRAAGYDIDDIRSEVEKIRAQGGEVGLHGIDAWCNVEQGRVEQQRVSQPDLHGEIGIRMHWLFFEQGSTAKLEQAGFTYDSTFGYNNTVGFRAGTAQVFRPLDTLRLLELPLLVMDTSLFYPDYRNLSCTEARPVVGGIMDDIARFGGALTVNWHDRSIFPERLWDDFYLPFVAELRRRRTWVPTAGTAVAWFRQRRSAAFESVRWAKNEVRVKISAASGEALPALRLRLHRPGGGFVDASLAPGVETCLSF